MKTTLGVLLAAIIYFAWGMISWMVLPWYHATMKTLPEQQLVLDTLKVVVEEPGLYSFPCIKDENGKPDMKAAEEAARKGPVGMMTIVPDGGEMMTPSRMAVSFIHGLLAACMVAWIFCIAGGHIKTLGWRVVLAAKLGGLAWLVRDVPYWNWMYFPLSYTLVNLAHLLIGFALMGLVLAYFVPVKD